MDRPNFYILLDLDPSQRDPAAIQAAIDQKQGEWARDRNHPTKSREAQRNLEFLPDIQQVLSDPQKRDAEAREAKRILKDLERKAYQALDETIRVLASPGYLLEKQVKYVVKQFDGRLREEEVRRRIKVEIREEPGPETRPKRPVLRRQLMKEIRDRLELVDKEKLHDLYDFLERSRSSSLNALLDRAQKLDAEIRAINRKTAKVTARQELAGHCLSIFRTEQERAKYDNALDQQGLEDLKPLIEAEGSLGQIRAEVMQQFLRKAREKGVAEDDARCYITDLAAKRKWLVQLPSSGRLPKLQRCGGCGVVNEEDANRCRQCGEPLKVECPQCKRANASDNRACSQCGFSVGDATLVRRLLRDAEVLLARDDTREARKLIEEAQVYWPDSDKAKSLLAAIEELRRQKQRRRRERDRAHDRVLAATGERRYCEAERRWREFARLAPDDPEKGNLAEEIRKGIARAKQHVTRARASEARGRADDAIESYLRALEECRDLQEARDGLAKCPPQPPQNLKAAAATGSVKLEWEARSSKGQIAYRVVRKAGSQPTAATDGDLVGETAGTSLTDGQAEAGELYYYAVFSERGGVPSRQAAVAGPVVCVEDVESLRATAGDGSVLLEWKQPPRARRIEVWRKEGREPRRGEGARLSAVSMTSATDTGLTNGASYAYRVVAVFDGPDGRPRYAPGRTSTAMPMEPPEAVTDLRVSRRGNVVEATWTPPRRGQVLLFASGNPPGSRCNDTMDVAELERLGKRVRLSGASAARLRVNMQSGAHLIPVTVSGSVAVVGRAVSISWVDDVQGLSAVVRDRTLFAQWKWPAGVDMALVTLRSDRFPTGPQDPQAARIRCLRPQYEVAGGFRHEVDDVDCTFLVVYAAVKRGQKWHYAEGLIPGARKEVAVSRHRKLRYQVHARRQLLGLGKKGAYDLVISPDAPTALPALVLVTKPDSMPLSPDDGDVVLRIDAGQQCVPGRPLTLEFRSPRKIGRHSVRLFAVHDADCEWLELIRGT